MSKLHTYDEYVEIYLSIAANVGGYIKRNDLKKHNLPDARWFLSNCDNKQVSSYSEFVEWIGLTPSYISKEKAKELIYKMQSKLNRPISYDDFRNPAKDETSIGVINRYWGSMNNMKKDLGLEIIQDDMVGKSKSKDELLNDLKVYVESNCKIPNSNDFGGEELMSSSTYFKYFGGINNAIELIGYVPNKRNISLYLSNDEICDMYKEMFDDNGGAFTYEYCAKAINLPSPTTVLRRFRCTWNEFLTMLGYDIVNTALGQVCEAKDGTMCLSKTECLIHNILISMTVNKIEKEVLYRDFCDGYSGFKRCDWIIESGDKKYIIEYFGLMQKDSYRKTHDEKLDLIDKNELTDCFIPLYPKDLNNIEGILKQKLNV